MSIVPPRIALLLGAMMLTAAAPETMLTGVWGGGRATLTLDATGGTLIEDCQTTTLTGPVRHTADGGFVVVGRREVHGGGPQAGDVAPTLIDVRLVGRVAADRIDLEVTRSGGRAERLVLTHGRRLKTIRCY